MITAVDIGATKTLIAQFGEDSKPHHEMRFATPANQQLFLETLTAQLAQLQNIDSVVVGAPGIITSEGVILRCGNLPWRNFALKEALTKLYSCPVYIQNDAKLAAVGEINAILPTPRLGIYLTISTGIGDGIVVNGRLLPELSGSEVGHMTIWDGAQWQTWETFGSGRALSAHFGKFAHDLHEPQEWQWVAQQVAVGLYALIPALQPQVIVLGGSVGTYFENYRQPLAALLTEHIASYIQLPELRQAQHPEEAVIYGGYYYARHQQAA